MKIDTGITKFLLAGVERNLSGKVGFDTRFLDQYSLKNHIRPKQSALDSALFLAPQTFANSRFKSLATRSISSLKWPMPRAK
jgi:hypothetical protein